MKHVFHVANLPHTVTSLEFSACAYTAKVYKFCKMMTERGHTVYHYGTEGSDAPCTEFIQIQTQEEQKLLCGNNNWKKKMFDIVWNENLPPWTFTNSRTILEMKKRLKDEDFICLIGGTCHKPIADALETDKRRVVEFGIGYRGVFAKYQVYESYSHLHKMMGVANSDGDGNFYHCVIPNYWDVSEFPLGLKEHRKNYFVYLGRCIKRKGIQIAVDTANATGIPLIIAGQGVDSYTPAEHGKPAKIVCTDSTFEGNFHFIGHVDVRARAALLGQAKALFCPTIDREPFGGTHAEALLCGTPVITTDFGVFTETVNHGEDGYRCHTHEQFVWAAKNLDKLQSHEWIRERAVRRWSLEKVSTMYEEYFDQLARLSGKGYYSDYPERTNLDWLKRR